MLAMAQQTPLTSFPEVYVSEVGVLDKQAAGWISKVQVDTWGPKNFPECTSRSAKGFCKGSCKGIKCLAVSALFGRDTYIDALISVFVICSPLHLGSGSSDKQLTTPRGTKSCSHGNKEHKKPVQHPQREVAVCGTVTVGAV